MILQFSTTTITVSIVIFSIYLIKLNGELTKLRKGQKMNAVSSNKKNNKSALNGIKDKACKLLTSNLKESHLTSYNKNSTYQQKMAKYNRDLRDYQQKMAKYNRDLRDYNAKYGRNRSYSSRSKSGRCGCGGNCAYGQCKSGGCACGGNCAYGQCKGGGCACGGNCAYGQCKGGRSYSYRQRGGGYHPYSGQQRGRCGSCYRR